MENKEPSPAELLKMFADGAKIRKLEWHPDAYLYLIGSTIYDNDGIEFDVSVTSLLNESWELYKEPKKLKRYWLWDMRKQGSSWFRDSNFLDEKGLASDGIKAAYWDNYEKRKAEPEQYIDVEVE